MKKIILLITIVTIFSLLVFSQGKYDPTQQGIYLQQQDRNRLQNCTENCDGIIDRYQDQIRDRNYTYYDSDMNRDRLTAHLKDCDGLMCYELSDNTQVIVAKDEQILTQYVNQQTQIANQKIMSMGDVDKEQREKQEAYNKMQIAVQTMLAIEDLAGGLGPEISLVAIGLDNSTHRMLKAEEEIQQRNKFTKFIAGGDHKSAQILQQEMVQNQERLQLLKDLHDGCECEEPIREILRGQIMVMEQEQIRTAQIIQEEKGKKGIIGWIWK